MAPDNPFATGKPINPFPSDSNVSVESHSMPQQSQVIDSANASSQTQTPNSVVTQTETKRSWKKFTFIGIGVLLLGILLFFLLTK